MPTVLYRLVSGLAHRAPLPRGKLRTSIAGRRGAAERWTRWASTHPTKKHRIWVHAASVGEYLTAEPVVRRVRHAHGVGQVICSFSSPSMADWPDHSWADAVDYIPLDERLPIEQTLRAVAPSLVIFSRGDLWPEFVHGAKRLDVPLVVIGGTKGRASKLHWLPKRSAARSVFTQLDWIGTNRTRDRERWRLAGAPESVIEITGDPRHDQIIERTMRLAAVHEVSQWTANKTLLVAGSTNAEDEQIVLQAFERIRFERQAVRVMIVPHERMPGHARRLFSRLRQSDVTHCKWSEGALDPDVQCVVVTRMGVLADLYAHADIAYVGGGFRKGGLHAVAEPAVYAVPVIVGPRYRDSTDAEEMVTANGAVALDSRAPVESLVRHWERFLDDVELRWKCGLNARKTMQEGAADRTVRALLRLLPDLGKPPSKTN